MHRYSWPLLIVTVAVVALLTIGAFIPGDAVPIGTGGDGTRLHLVGVGLVAFCIVLALPDWWAASIGAIIAAIGMAELAQPIFGRGAQWSDFWAGGAGSLVGAAGAGAVLAALRSMRHDD